MVGAYCGWNPSNFIAQMTKMNGNPHIWRLKIDMPFVEASDNGVKFVGNNAFGNNYVPVDQWSNPYGVCELNPAGRAVSAAGVAVSAVWAVASAAVSAAFSAALAASSAALAARSAFSCSAR